MTLFQIIQILKEIALTQPNIKSATDGSIYDVMNTNPSVKYDVVHFSQTTHQSDEETDYYGLNIFYVSRLEDSLEDNRLQIQSIGKEILDNIIRTFCENWSIDFPTITYTPFTQKFNDLCAGCYCNLRLEIPKEIICADDYIGEVIPSEKDIRLQDISVTIKENGTRVVTPSAGFDGIGQITINTEVPETGRLEDKDVLFEENGEFQIEPSAGYDGIYSVLVTVDVPSDYDEGYDDGKEDGINEQKAKLVVTSFTENNIYTRADGWSAVTVNVPQGQGYEEGYEDGQAAQKAKLIPTAITENGTYTREDGYSTIEVNVPAGEDRYEEGFNDGIQYQKDKMVTTSVTENGLYIREDGYSAFFVEVTTSGNEDLIANLQGDYYLIPNGTDHLREWAFYNTCFSSITIPDSVRIINDYAFAGNTCLTSITIPSSVTNIGSYVFSGDSSLEEMTFDGTTPPTLGNTGNSLGDTAYTFPIYVPCPSIEAYRTAFGEYYSPRIECKSEVPATAITLNVSSAITDAGQAYVTVEPSGAVTNLVFSSSDSSIATIDQSGNIVVISDGQVEFCVVDTYTNLTDCKTVSVSKTDYSSFGMAIYNVKTTSSRTEILGPSGYNSFDYMIYNGKRTNIGSGATGYTFSATGRQVVYYHFRDPQTLKKAAFWRGKNNWNDPLPLVAFTMPQTVRTIEDYAFRTTALEYFTLPKNVTAITKGGQEFYGCKKLSGFTFESGSTIQNFTPGLYDTHITTLSIPDNVKVIGYMQMNTYLSSVTIGTGITKISNSTFANCSALTTVTINKTTPPTLETDAFANTSLQNIYVPANSVNAYKTASGWSQYASKIQAKP